MADNLGTFAELKACSNAERGVVDQRWIKRLKDQLRGLTEKSIEKKFGDFGKAFAEDATPSAMIYPGVGVIVIGVLVLLQGVELL